MTKLKFINKYILQWLFIRLTKCIDNESNEYWYSLQYLVVPTTGWTTDFKFVGNRKLFKITKKYEG